MKVDEWCRLSSEGWILAPQESKSAFFERKEAFEKADPSKEGGGFIALYDFHIKTVPIIYSKKSLWPWQGAVLWEYTAKGGGRYPVIQLREKEIKGYRQKELLSHELVHAARFAFKEPLFEEVFAYRTSASMFRRFLGPLFIYPIEATIFTCACIGSFLTSALGIPLLGILISLSVFSCFFFRLLLLQWVFFLAKNHLENAGVSSAHSLAVLVRLSDREIMKIAWMSSSQKIRKFFLEKSAEDVRFQVLVTSYCRF